MLGYMPMIIQNALVDDFTTETRSRGLSMVGQWKRWRWRFWKYEETETYQVKVYNPQAFRLYDNVLVMSPASYQLFKNITV